MSSASLDSYRELAATLTPAAVQQYLAANQWELENPDLLDREVWRLPGRRARVMLPLAMDYVDYPQRFSDTLRALAKIYDWDPAFLAERITATHTDLLSVRLDQATVDGTIPFRQAEKTLEGLLKMMRAAATTADDPTHSHRGRRSSTVTRFLDDDVRLAHTQRGSFVFTVVTRLGDPAVDGTDNTTSDVTDSADVFARRVMVTLANALIASRDLALSRDPQAIEQAAQRGLSANLVESLLDLTASESLRKLDLSFAWAAAMPAPDVATSRIEVDRDTIAGLPLVRERLVRREQPARMETLVGTVRSLTRGKPDEDEQEETTIVLTAEVDGRDRNVRIPLSGDDYTWAIYAHTNRLPFTVTGNLAFERGTWRLIDHITVDASFLAHRQRTTPGSES